MTAKEVELFEYVRGVTDKAIEGFIGDMLTPESIENIREVLVKELAKITPTMYVVSCVPSQADPDVLTVTLAPEVIELNFTV